MKMSKWLGILLISALLCGGCGNQENIEDVIVEVTESAINEPQKATVIRGDLQVVEYYDAQIGPRVEQLTFGEDGTFGELCVQLGDAVKVGDILATPAVKNMDQALEDKEKELENLTVTYNYQKATLENDIAIAKQELENIYDILEDLEYLSEEYTANCIKAGEYDEQRKKLELQLKHLQETYELELPYCQKQLERLRKESNGNMITAPFDGTVVALAEAEYGDTINTEQYYVAVADTSVEYARCEKINDIVLRQYEKAVFWKDGIEYEMTHIPMDYDYYMETQNNKETAYSEFEIVDPDGAVSIGDYGKVKVILKERKDVLLIPENTLILSGLDYYVYRDADGVYEKVPVKIGATNGINVEILEGLEEGDVVYVQE